MPAADAGHTLSRRSLLARTGGLALAAGGTSLLAACGNGGEPAGDTGAAASGSADARFKTLTVGVASPPSSLDPHKTTSSELGAFNQMYEGLVNRTQDRTIVPGIAAGQLEQVDDTTWRARLRDDRTFTDGSPITAEDVVFSWDRVRGRALGSPYRDYLGFITSVKAVGGDTIELKTSGPVDIVPQRAALVRIVSKRVVTAKGDRKFAVDPGVGSGSMFNAQPLSTNAIALRAYDGYNGDLPVYTDAATYEYVAEGATRFANLRGGQLQIDADISPDLYDAARSAQGVQLGLTPLDASTKICLCMFNCRRPLFSDPRVRQAVIYAIDREQLVQIGNQGQAKVADSPLPTSEKYHVTPTVTYDHDPEKAKSLLREAGHPDGISFELNVSNLGGTKEYAPLLAQQLKAAGIDVKLRVRSVDLAFPEIFAGKYDAFIFPTQFEVFSYDPDILIRGWWGGTFNQSAAFWTTPGAKRIPRLLDDALVATSEDDKRRLYGDAQQIIMEEAASCPLIFQPGAVGWSDKLSGFKVSTVGWAPAIYGVKPA